MRCIVTATSSFHPPLVLVTLESPSALPLGDLTARSATTRLQLAEHERISPEAIANNPVLRTFLRKTKERGGRLHVIGMLSDGSGHTSLAHLYALIGVAEQAAVRVVVHAIVDGVDPAQRTAAGVLADLETRLSGGVGRIGTVSGRAWTVDADGRWDRIEKLFRAMMADGVTRFDTALAGVKDACQFGKPEGFVAPFVVFDYPGVSLVDSAIHVHASPGGARALTRALCAPSFEPFLRGPGQAPFQGRCASMVPYDSDLSLPTLFPRAADPAELPWALVTRGGRTLWRAEPGPLQSMVDAAVQKIRQGGCDCAVVDLASPDSVARSTDPQALTRALGAIADAALTVGGALLVVGSANAEGNMACAYVSEPRRSLRPQGGGDDLAPTLLDLLQLPADADSEGVSLLNPE
jgi:2,3-bisphosphoglycerate-independent phosphoglycerate mutase